MDRFDGSSRHGADFVTTFRNALVECYSFEDAAAVNAADDYLRSPRLYRVTSDLMSRMETALRRYGQEDAADELLAIARDSKLNPYRAPDWDGDT